MEHTHPVKKEEGQSCSMAGIGMMANSSAGSANTAVSPQVPPLPCVQLMANNESPSLVNSAWLLLANLVPTRAQGIEPISVVRLHKLVVLRYLGEGHKSRLFLVKDGSEERALKLYHSFPSDMAEAEAYEILNRDYDKDKPENSIAPKYNSSYTAVYEVRGVQIRAYAITMHYIRAESLCEVAHKLHGEAVDDFESQLNACIRWLHEKGIAHGNISASNVLIDDSSRYQASLEHKPLSRTGVRVRLIGFSSAKFKEKTAKQEWDKARRDDFRMVTKTCGLIRSQADTTVAIKLVKRICANERQDLLRQRSLVRTLPTADPLDNELHAGLYSFQSAQLPLVTAAGEHFGRGGQHEAALEWLRCHKDLAGRGKPEEYVTIHVMIAETLGRLNRPVDHIEEAWKQAIQFSSECTGLASRKTIMVRRDHAMWLWNSARPKESFERISLILQDVMSYYRRGTGSEMIDDEEFMKDLSSFSVQMKSRKVKEEATAVAPQGSPWRKLNFVVDEFAEFTREVEASRKEKRRKPGDSKKEQTPTKQSSRSDLGPSDGIFNDKPAVKRPSSPDPTPKKKARTKSTPSKKPT